MSFGQTRDPGTSTTQRRCRSPWTANRNRADPPLTARSPHRRRPRSAISSALHGPSPRPPRRRPAVRAAQIRQR